MCFVFSKAGVALNFARTSLGGKPSHDTFNL